MAAAKTTTGRAATAKKKPARRAKPGERAAALVLADAERGDLIAGADEAGRGCLAGPLVAAAVLIEPVKLVGLLEFDESRRKTKEPPRMPEPEELVDNLCGIDLPRLRVKGRAGDERLVLAALDLFTGSA